MTVPVKLQIVVKMQFTPAWDMEKAQMGIYQTDTGIQPLGRMGGAGGGHITQRVIWGLPEMWVS